MTHANTTNWKRRLPLFALSNATHVISTYGTNDLRVGLITTLAGMQSTKQVELALYQQYRPGVMVLGAPLLPRTNSTDSWATTGNQTAQTNFSPLGGSVREQYNAWLRGRPAGFSGVLDPNLASETSVDSGVWVVNGAANYATSDGTHPSQAIHAAIANALPLGRVT